MSIVVDWLHSSLGKIEHKLFKDVVRVEAADKVPLGDGQVVLISDIGRIVLTLVSKDGDKKEVKAIVKLESQVPTGKQIADAWGAFETEIKMYNEILRFMEKLMDEMGDSEYMWADCYHCGDKKLLFQDLCEYGCKIVPTHKFLDLEHACLVMKGIGKFHAMSAVMKERNLIDSDSFRPPYYAAKLPAMHDSIMQSLIGVTDVIRSEWGPEWSSVPDRLLKYFENPNETLYKAWKSSNGKYDVLNHGDFSMRNMLFHYPHDSDQPDQVKFVDFQVCHYSNPANDLINLLYSSIRPRIRDENIDLLLRTYVDSFTLTANQLGFEGIIPTFDEIKATVDSLKPIILLHLLFSLPLFIMSGKEDVQKKANEFMDKFESLEDFKKQCEDKSVGTMLQYNDPEVQDVLKYEIKKFVDKNII